MTRETKAGLVVAASFIGLMAAVLVKKFVFHSPSGDEKALAQVTEKNGKAPEATPIQPGKMDLVPVPPSGEIKLTTGDEKSPPPPDPTPVAPPPPPGPVEKKEEGGIPPLPGVNDKSAIPSFPLENKGGIPPLPLGKEKEIPPVAPVTTPSTTIPPPVDPVSPNPGGATSIPPAPPVGTTTIPPITNVPPLNFATPVIPPPPSGVGTGATVIPIPPEGSIPSLPMNPAKVEPVVPPPAPVGNTIPPPPVAPGSSGLNSGTVPPAGLITPPLPPAPASIGNPTLNSTSPSGTGLGRSNGTTSFDAVEGPANRSEFIPSNSRVTPGVPTGYIPPGATGGNGGFITPMPGNSVTPLGPNQIISAPPLNSSTPVPLATSPGAVLTIPSSGNGGTAPATVGNNLPAATTPLAPKVESWSEQVYYCQPGDTYAGVSQKVYRNADYAKALQLWNENHPRNRIDAPKTGVLIPGQEVYFPPTSELSRKYGAYIPKLSPVSGGPGVGNSGVVPIR